MWKEQRKERWKEEMANKQIPLLDFYSSLSSPYPIYHPPYYTTPLTMTDPPRTSSRPRQKSQRAREHEDTKRYLKQQLDSPAKIPRPRPKGKPKHRSYCICKQDTPGPMIECDVCSDWYVALFYPAAPGGLHADSSVRFHFKCIHLAEDDAEKIRTFYRVPSRIETNTCGKRQVCLSAMYSLKSRPIHHV